VETKCAANGIGFDVSMGTMGVVRGMRDDGAMETAEFDNGGGEIEVINQGGKVAGADMAEAVAGSNSIKASKRCEASECR